LTHTLSLCWSAQIQGRRRAVERVLKTKQCRACHCTCSAAANGRSGAMLFLSMPNRRKKKKRKRLAGERLNKLLDPHESRPCENTDSVCTRKHCTPSRPEPRERKSRLDSKRQAIFVFIYLSLLYYIKTSVLALIFFKKKFLHFFRINPHFYNLFSTTITVK
jgi:hypothetical protein